MATIRRIVARLDKDLDDICQEWALEHIDGYADSDVRVCDITIRGRAVFTWRQPYDAPNGQEDE